MFEGFEQRRIATPEVEINLRIGGSGPPLLLLHGYPQTHAMWHRIAPALAEHFTIVASDLRGYGDSDRPTSTPDHMAYAKRTMATDQVAVMAALGYQRFALCGHDRGARVAYRLALDYDCVESLAVLDIVPTLVQFERMGKNGAMASYHWFFLAQPEPFPETLIAKDPDYFVRHTLSSWARTDGAFSDEAMAAYLRCFRDPDVIHATCEDYRAGATVDCEIDAGDRTQGRRISCPVLALWGTRGKPHKRQDVLETWRGWADNVSGQGIDCGHFLPEEAPQETLGVLLEFFAP